MAALASSSDVVVGVVVVGVVVAVVADVTFVAAVAVVAVVGAVVTFVTAVVVSTVGVTGVPIVVASVLVVPTFVKFVDVTIVEATTLVLSVVASAVRELFVGIPDSSGLVDAVVFSDTSRISTSIVSAFCVVVFATVGFVASRISTSVERLVIESVDSEVTAVASFATGAMLALSSTLDGTVVTLSFDLSVFSAEVG